MINSNMINTLSLEQTLQPIVYILFTNITFLCVRSVACNVCSVDKDVSLFSSIASYQ